MSWSCQKAASSLSPEALRGSNRLHAGITHLDGTYIHTHIHIETNTAGTVTTRAQA